MKVPLVKFTVDKMTRPKVVLNKIKEWTAFRKARQKDSRTEGEDGVTLRRLLHQCRKFHSMKKIMFDQQTRPAEAGMVSL